ncbi:MAG: molybdopterin-guanine dinucleotide biosynthesis protein MobB [Oscillospiraceae bacterium]|nr:molybdopterin-guanine dinucleotide biosynthesis protein MobB [Oscillospiraceae bacterium]
MKVFTVIGTSGSGKTSVIEALTAELCRRGFRVGTVKEIHYEAFAIDPDPASNTRRHRAAGAELVTARGCHETDFLYPEKLPMKNILKHYKDYDWVALEGVEDLAVPAVLCAHDPEGLELKRNNPEILAEAACVSGRVGARLKEYQGLPAFDVLENAAALCDFLEARVPVWLECYDPGDPDSGVDISFSVDGAPIPMVPFVQRILRNAVLGVVRELEGCGEGMEVEIRLK